MVTLSTQLTFSAHSDTDNDENTKSNLAKQLLIAITIFRESKGLDSELKIFNRWCLVPAMTFKLGFQHL